MLSPRPTPECSFCLMRTARSSLEKQGTKLLTSVEKQGPRLESIDKAGTKQKRPSTPNPSKGERNQATQAGTASTNKCLPDTAGLDCASSPPGR